MRRPVSPDPLVDVQLLGILLAGALIQTRPECSADALLKLSLRPSGVHRIVRAVPPVPSEDGES